MGCAASSTAAAVMEENKEASTSKLAANGKKALSESTKKASDEESDPAQQQQQQREQFTPSTAPGSPPQSERPQVSALTHVSSSPLSVKSAHSNASSQVRKDAWAVRPGYSSGASSYEGSDDGRLSDGELYEQERLTLEGSFMDRSRHSNVDGCALGSLRQTIANQGGLTESVVRIETPFGQPIEEVYQGVHDGPVLGSGVSGIVRLIQHRATGLKYAVKILDLGLIDSTEGLKQLRDEIFIMCQLDHPNIVRIEEVYESMNEIYIVQELCLGGDLFDRLDEQPDYHYTEAECARLVKQMLSSVRYLHSKGIIHRDMKLENFLFSSRAADSDLKMIDFGLSKHFELGQCHTEKVGTPYTVAPEIIRGNYDEKSDIWALGVITYLLLSGETPFGGLDGESMMSVKQSILRAQVLFEPEDVWENVSVEGKGFVKRLLNPEQAMRPTAKEAQKDVWIQVWAKKSVKDGARLNAKTVGALMAFKEYSDMQKLLSEVLSFTLLPEQIVDLKKEFEKIDKNGDGEISLMAMKQVLMENAEAGSLGALTEREIEDLFDAIRLRKTDTTIRWHEFLAAGLSQARVDDRNLRLAFDRLDTDRKGFITFEDMQDLLGNTTEYESLERIWRDSLLECRTNLDRITYDDFKRLMKGQPKEQVRRSSSTMLFSTPQAKHESAQLEAVPERDRVVESSPNLLMDDEEPSLRAEEEKDGPDSRSVFRIKRSRSYEQKASVWEHSVGNLSLEDVPPPVLDRDASRAVLLPNRSGDAHAEILKDSTASPLVVNRALYRKHREMRFAVLDASKQFDKKRNEIQSQSAFKKASLIMKRGVRPPVELEDAHQRALFEAAARRCGRARRTRNKTVSDVTGMLLKAQA